MINKKINKILKQLKGLEKDGDIRYVFSYMYIGDNLNSLDADVVDNLKGDLASSALINVIDEKIFENPIMPEKPKDNSMSVESLAKLNMFNLFNKGKKYKA